MNRWTIDDIKTQLRLCLKYGTHVEIMYIPEFVLNDPRELYGVYYGGSYRMTLGKYSRIKFTSITLTETNLDEVAASAMRELDNDVSEYIIESLNNLGWDDVEIKYLENDEEKYKQFLDEVNRLRNDG